MKFLCLHGKGTSAEIFESQTASFRFKLDSSIEFEFIDGLYPSAPAPDIVHFYNPPYYSFWEGSAVAAIRASHTWLLSKLARDGPYDGILAFSQGCVFVSSFLLYHQAANPEAPPPFKTAIFICGGLSLLVLEDLGIKVDQEAHDWDQRSRVLLQKATNSASVLIPGADRWETSKDFDLMASKVGDPNRVDLHNVFGLDLTQLAEERKIRIPTVHIYGSGDPRLPASLQLAYLCDGAVREMYDHGGGHDIPRSKLVSETIAQLVRWSMKMVETTK